MDTLSINPPQGLSPAVPQSRSPLGVRQESPQVRIYNRNFYLRRAERDLLQQQHERSVRELANSHKISQSSYGILSAKLELTIQAAIQLNSNATHTVTFEQAQKIINQVLQVANVQTEQSELLQTQIWLILSGYQVLSSIESRKMFSLLRILMDPYNLSSKEILALLSQIECFHGINEQREAFIKQHPQLKEETLPLREVVRLWSKIKMSSASAPKKLSVSPNAFSFQPQINAKSRVMAEKSLNKYLSSTKLLYPSPNQLEAYIHPQHIQYHNILHNRKLQKDLLLQTDRKQEDTEEIYTSKTGTLQDIKRIVDNLYVQGYRRTEEDWHIKSEEEELKLCSFKPQTIPYNRSKSPFAVKSFDKNVERLARGRKERNQKQEALQNLGQVKKSSNKSTAPSFLSRDTPKLILEINIDDSRIEKIKLRGDQDPRIVAKKFVAKHGLDESMQSVLQELVEEHLNAL